jgi:hypothetical protein
VVRLLEEHFNRLIDYGFTAELEGVLDDIAGGRVQRQEVLSGFYFGSDAADDTGLKRLVSELGEIDAKGLATFPLGEGIDLRVGRYGPYVESGDGTRANVPDDLPPDELTLDKARELLANPAGEERVLGEHPETGRTVVAKNGRYGPYVTELLPDDAPKKERPRTSSLFKSMALDAVTLDDAVRLLSIRGWWAPTRRPATRSRPQRPLRALPEEGHRLALDRVRGATAHHHPRRGVDDLRAAQAAGRSGGGSSAQGARSRPCVGQPHRGARTAASVPTSPTGSTTRRCARMTRSRRSRRSEQLSCWRTSGPEGRPRRPQSVALGRRRPPRRRPRRARRRSRRPRRAERRRRDRFVS